MKFCVKALALVCGLLLAAPAVVCAQEEEVKTTNILFIGNSYTFYNSLNAMLEDMLTVSGVPTKAVRSTPGGWRLSQHFKGEVPAKYKEAPTPERIKEQKWDYVVLQEQSSGAVDSHEEYMEYGQKLMDMIHENCADTKVILYQTWGRCDGMFSGYGDDETRKAEVLAAWEKRYSKPSEATVAQLKTGMQGACADLQQKTGCMLAPVGEAFAKVGDTLDLHAAEGDKRPHHPNPNGTYLGACVFFKTITGQSPVGLWQKLAAAEKDHKVSEEDAAYLEKIADEIVK